MKVIKWCWLSSMGALLVLALWSVPQSADWDDGPVRGLFAMMVVLPSLLALPISVVATPIVLAVVPWTVDVLGASGALGRAMPFFIAAGIGAAGYLQWFVLVPKLFGVRTVPVHR